MASGGKGGGKSGKGGGGGHASNAALQDDEDVMARRRALFGKWKVAQRSKKAAHPKHMIDYVNSPAPEKRS